MDPQEGSARFPFSKFFALENPCRGSAMSGFRNTVLVHRRVRRGEPVLHLFLQLVAYNILSVTATDFGKSNQLTLGLVYFIQRFVECDYDLMSARALSFLRKIQIHTQILSNSIRGRLAV